MRFHPCYLLIPMRYGRSGEPVSPEGLTQIFEVFVRQFGGYTPLGPVTSPPGVKPGGQWIDPDTGEEVPDETWQVLIAVAPDRLETFRKVVRAIGAALEQKEMFVDIRDASVEFLTVVTDEPADAEQLRLFDDLEELFRDEGENDANSGSAAVG